MSDLKFCKDCKWSKPDKIFFFIPDYEHSSCTNPAMYKKPKVNLVTGALEPVDYRYCITLRGYFSAECGHDGKGWEAK